MENKMEWKIPSNYIYKGKTLMGHICFYSSYFIYKADAVNTSIVFHEVNYSEINGITNTNTFGFLPNGLLITTVDGDEYKFTVINRDKVRQFLENKIPDVLKRDKENS